MNNPFKRNCCDGIYNSFDVHFTSACDNKCGHCIDSKYEGLHISKPDVDAISKTIIENQEDFDDVLFLGGEPCLFLDELLECVKILRAKTNLKLYVTTSIPKTCYDNSETFFKILYRLDGINLSVQHHKEDVADLIRKNISKYDRQSFYNCLPYKEKIRINLNIVKPFLYTKEDITECICHYDKMGFNSIKLSEIQHGKEFFTSFEKTFDVKLGSPFYHGCQTYIDPKIISSDIKTPILLKRSCFMCEETLGASFMDLTKSVYKIFEKNTNNKYAVVYENGLLSTSWR